MLNKNLLVVFTNNFLVFFFFENLQNGANWMGSMDTEFKKKIKTYGKLDYLQIACLCVGLMHSQFFHGEFAHAQLQLYF